MTIGEKKERHAAKFHAVATANPVLFTYTPSGPFDSEEHFSTEFVEQTSYADPTFFTFALIDKTRGASAEDDDGELAGMMSYFRTSETLQATEIGWIYILPA
ncbi:hypothetical protein BN1723_016303 [Verticillium longisporum]|uniref:Uncharacterized protein n=1 Tax=Verticillium longisporum TaxID=100787 RepID=A0A0G4NCD7_VERLO|nr:hypothetical protein HYQ46_012414 [Verticillium longisporum]CRK32676.1 hypothetical protein BN1708_016133 [Verticillium longisporum]CRK44024.1 hypothetical protein BN1723_016303 [Verticillium longisporum]